MNKCCIMILILLIISARSVISQQNELPPNVKMISDIVYSHPGSRELKLDIFVPEKGTEPFAVIVYIHGGGWSSGSRRQFHRYAAQMAAFGFAGLTIEYRLSFEAKYPAAVQDCREAILWVKTNAKKYNFDPKRIGVAGQSAGGYLAALLGVTSNDTLPVAALNPVLDFTAIAGTNFDEANSAITNFLGSTYSENPILWKEASPITHISKDSPPMLLLHGTADSTVPYSQSVDMYNKLKMEGVPAELYSVEGARHLWFFNSNEYFLSSLNQIREFFQKYLQSKK